MRGNGHEESEGPWTWTSLLEEVFGPTPQPLLPIPGERLGGPDGQRYEVLDWMGGGGMGQVFRARDETLHREVALKFLLSCACSAEVLREARAVARLDHENIVRIFDAADWKALPDEPGVPFLVMECLEGESLAGLLKRGRLEVRHALEVLDGISVGLAHAHERGLLHRDLKPGNVFLTPAGTVKLLDFGLSHLLVASAGLAPHLSMAGTPAYMAPEQWRGERQDARTDIWAAGVVLYRMLTGEPPFPAASVAELRERVTSPEPAPPIRVRHPEVPRPVAVLLATALAKDPARRFSSALELREELRELRGRLFGSGRKGGGPSAELQRRQVSLVSCQLAGVAEGGAPLDAEDLGELELAFHEASVEVIERHGGSVALSMGGEVLACFGWAQGREDDSERAVRTGLQLTRELRDTLQRRLPHLPLSGLAVRGGVHTELMAVGTRLQGEAPKMAAWLAHQAGQGEVAVSDTTWKLVRGAFQSEPLGPHAFEGLSGSVCMETHRVLGEREVAFRFERTRVAGRLSPLVGRERELGWLLERWEQARRGQGAFVLVSGEAGIGKSRLIQALCERAAEPSKVIRVQCWPRFSPHAMPPLIEMLQAVAGIRPEEPPPLRLEKLEERLRNMGVPREDTHLLALLLELPVPEDSPVLRLTPARRREKTFESLACLFTRCPREHPPRLLVIEDLHWADSALLELLGFLLEKLSSARLLIVLSARPELPPDWPRREGVDRLVLERLPGGLAADLVREVAGERELPEETVQALVRKTDGIPLFIEELTRLMLEDGAVASIPLTLHELLLARLDLLPSRQKALAQQGAVVGRTFSLSLLAAVSERDEATLRRDLAGLMEAGLLQEQAWHGMPGYEFRHALFQETAYQSLSRSARRQHHRRIARMWAERLPQLEQERPEVLAHHLTEAGEHARAIPCWARAGKLAVTSMAGQEAMGHLSRALELLPALPEGDSRLHEELRLRMLLGMAMMQVQDCFSPEVVRMYERIHELIGRVGEALPRLELLWWSPFGYHFARAEYPQVQELAERLVDLGQRHGHRGLWVLGNRTLTSVLCYRGRQHEALESLEHTLARADFTLEEQRTLAEQYWLEPKTTVMAYGAIVHASLGRMRESRRWIPKALAMAGRVGHPHTTAYTQLYAALACVIHRDAPEVLRLAEQLIELARERGFVWWREWATVLRGWALSELGQPREGLEIMRRPIEYSRREGLRVAMPLHATLLAMVHLKLEQVREALEAIHWGLALGAETGDRNSDSGLHLLRGECLRRLGRKREARQCVLRAITIAREQGAVLFELRATVSLGRQLRDLGLPRVAGRLLSRLLARFEGEEDGLDLQEARAMLAELEGDTRWPTPSSRPLSGHPATAGRSSSWRAAPV